MSEMKRELSICASFEGVDSEDATGAQAAQALLRASAILKATSNWLLVTPSPQPSNANPHHDFDAFKLQL